MEDGIYYHVADATQQVPAFRIKRVLREEFKTTLEHLRRLASGSALKGESARREDAERWHGHASGERCIHGDENTAPRRLGWLGSGGSKRRLRVTQSFALPAVGVREDRS